MQEFYRRLKGGDELVECVSSAQRELEETRNSAATSSPGIVPLGTNVLPMGMTRMPGVSANHVSAYADPLPLSNGITVWGKQLVGRADGLANKNYGYWLGSSPEGQICFVGSFKDFAGHHVSTHSVASYFFSRPGALRATQILGALLEERGCHPPETADSQRAHAAGVTMGEGSGIAPICT
jgi:hypothetical protein